jgi:hypothetical protein
MRFNVASCSAALVGDVVVPSSVSTVVVIAENDCVLCKRTISCIFHITNSVELFSDLSFNDLVLL